MIIRIFKNCTPNCRLALDLEKRIVKNTLWRFCELIETASLIKANRALGASLLFPNLNLKKFILPMKMVIGPFYKVTPKQ